MEPQLGASPPLATWLGTMGLPTPAPPASLSRGGQGGPRHSSSAGPESMFPQDGHPHPGVWPGLQDVAQSRGETDRRLCPNDLHEAAPMPEAHMQPSRRAAPPAPTPGAAAP